ncbi:MAG: response regulator [Dongiaceae bacterium]
MSADRLLIAEDEARIGSLLKMVAEECGYEVRVAVNGAAVKEMVRAFDPTLISLDLGMPGVLGVEMLWFLSGCGSQAKILITSGQGRDVIAVAEQRGKSAGLNMVGSIPKPVRLEQLRTIFRELRSTGAE